eukprot:jgi/Chlat1/8375/Chrsp80S07803
MAAVARGLRAAVRRCGSMGGIGVSAARAEAQGAVRGGGRSAAGLRAGEAMQPPSAGSWRRGVRGFLPRGPCVMATLSAQEVLSAATRQRLRLQLPACDGDDDGV